MGGDSPADQPPPARLQEPHAGKSPAAQRVVAAAEALLCSSIPTQILIGTLLRLAGWSPVDGANGQLSMQFVLVLSVTDTLLLVVLMVALTRAHGESVTGLWLGRAPVRQEVAFGALMIPVVFLMVVVLLNVLRLLAPWLHNVPTNPLEQLAATPGQAVLFAVVAILAGGVREELQRAFLLRRFEQHLGGARAGVIVVSVGFGAAHVVQGWDAVITTGLLGAFWAVMYLRRRSVVAAVVSHAGFNALEVLRVAVTGQS
jgi:membrane protease YdiL (CAAX protease family)